MQSHTFHQVKTISALLLLEVKAGWTKQKVILKAGVLYALGTVLAQDADKKYVALDPTSPDAEKVAVAVLGETIDASKGDMKGVVIKRGAVLDLAELVWPAGITDAQKTSALEQLEVLGIVAATPL
jgi:hypothetical protein